MIDIYDGETWTEMAIRDLTAALAFGALEDAAQHLCRSGTVDDVRHKAGRTWLLTKEKPP